MTWTGQSRLNIQIIPHRFQTELDFPQPREKQGTTRVEHVCLTSLNPHQISLCAHKQPNIFKSRITLVELKLLLGSCKYSY